jgi:hypothetical protein
MFDELHAAAQDLSDVFGSVRVPHSREAAVPVCLIRWSDCSTAIAVAGPSGPSPYDVIGVLTLRAPFDGSCPSRYLRTKADGSVVLVVGLHPQCGFALVDASLLEDRVLESSNFVAHLPDDDVARYESLTALLNEHAPWTNPASRLEQMDFGVGE